MRQSQPRFAAGLAAILPFLLTTSLAFPQTVQETPAVGTITTIEITVDDPHPMYAAIQKVMELSGIPIHFEASPIYYSGDLQDVTDRARSPLPPDYPRLIAPRQRGFSVSIAVDEATGRLQDMEALQTALTALVSAYNSSDLPGAYEVERSHGVFFVKPVRYRDASGATQLMTPLLSTRITLPEEKRDAYLTVQLILQQVSREAGVVVGSAVNLGLPREITFGADNEPASHVIARWIAAMVCPGSRRDLCDPAITQNSWDVGRAYVLGFDPNPITSSALAPFGLGVHQVPNSGWRVPLKPLPLPPNRFRQPLAPRSRGFDFR